jgi:hypothetical protein
MVLASNGVWQIVGTSQNGFTATGYEVKKLSSLGCVGQQSVVEVDDSILYWSYNAICKIGKDNIGQAVVQPITDLNIKTLYNSIPPVAKAYASGIYNGSAKTIYWAFNGLLTDSTTFPYAKDSILALDARLNAFYTLSLPTTSGLPVVTDVLVTKEILEQDTTYTVVDNSGNNVIDGSSNSVIANLTATYANEQQFKFLTVLLDGTPSSPYAITFSDFLNERDTPSKFADWFAFDGVGSYFNCYLVTGYSFAPNGPSKRKQATYITTFMARTETGFDVDFNEENGSSCTLYSKWDFTDSANANKWGNGQQIYRHVRMFIPNSTAFDDGYPVVVTKNKLRGRGRTLQLKFEADPELDMKLFGWSTVIYGGTNV